MTSLKTVKVDKVVNLNNGEYSKAKCKRVKTTELDQLIARISQLLTKNDKCEIIEKKVDTLIKTDKPAKKKRTKVATKGAEKRGDKLKKELGMTRRELLLFQ
jgi:hypothetical protein